MAARRYEVEGLGVEEAPATAPAGDRPPLLLVHGAGHGAWCWEQWMSVLPGKGWHCHAMSLRNHPGSYEVPREDYLSRLTVDDYAEDMRKVAAHIGRPCILVAHSMGGITSLKYLADQHAAGESQAGLVLLTAAPPGQLGPIRDEAMPTDKPFALDPELAAHRYFRSTDPAVTGPVLKRLVAESPSVVNHYSIGAGVPIDPAAITCPTLVVSAEFDRSPAPRDGRIAKFLGCDFMMAADIGHDLMVDEGWERVLEPIEAWLAARFPAA